MPKANQIDIPDRDNTQSLGVVAMTTPAGAIQLFTDAGDDAVSEITPADARKLAAWLTAAADDCEASAATT
jgi:hypothetical protein